MHKNGPNYDDRISTPNLNEVASLDREILKADIEQHLRDIGLWNSPDGGNLSKESIREIHKAHKDNAHSRIRKALGNNKIEDLVKKYIANGDEINPENIDPEVVLVDTEKLGQIFRFATLFWSIPVSIGYGRRMRFLVKDKQKDKLIGIFALCDPVFNLAARDEWIGWNQAERRERLVNTMSAYVVGAVPPYSELLGGKLITALIGANNVGQMFEKRYGNDTGIISGKRKNARLTLVTLTSALGRSSIYNRVKLFNGSRSEPVVALHRRGFTKGFGHFQIKEEHFRQLRLILEEDGHSNTSPRMGTGPNWRIRITREGLKAIGLDDRSILRHGIQREVYVMPIADNAREFLSGADDQPIFEHQHSALEIAELAKKRWIIPRGLRRPSYRDFNRKQIQTDVLGSFDLDRPTSHS